MSMRSEGTVSAPTAKTRAAMERSRAGDAFWRSGLVDDFRTVDGIMIRHHVGECRKRVAKFSLFARDEATTIRKEKRMKVRISQLARIY